MAKQKPAKAVTEIRTLSSANANPLNPRTIRDDELVQLRNSLKRFGDLSGIILNRTTNQLVGGHQRIEAFQQEQVAVTITEELKEADRTGTVAYGYITLHGTRYGYREVQWSAERERIANLAANKMGGQWDNALLVTALKAIRENPDGFTMEDTGFSDSELTRLLAEIERTPGEKGEPSKADDEYSLFELVMHHEHKVRFVNMLDLIRKDLKLPQLEEAIMKLCDCYEENN